MVAWNHKVQGVIIMSSIVCVIFIMSTVASGVLT